jgi:hypothetical protein
VSSTPIPTKQREAVKSRDRNQCARCAGRGTQWHHRRSRSVRDQHTHCTCNGIWLCRTCHEWVHAHPFEARAKGWIVSRHSIPAEMQMEHGLYGWVRLTCNALWSLAHSYEKEDELSED